MKPIEPGCLALASLPPDKGVPVHVVSVIGEVPAISELMEPGHRAWAIDSPLGGFRITCDCCLTRIDGDPDAVPEKTDEEIPA